GTYTNTTPSRGESSHPNNANTSRKRRTQGGRRRRVSAGYHEPAIHHRPAWPPYLKFGRKRQRLRFPGTGGKGGAPRRCWELTRAGKHHCSTASRPSFPEQSTTKGRRFL